jgi:hypothetical protein
MLLNEAPAGSATRRSTCASRLDFTSVPRPSTAQLPNLVIAGVTKAGTTSLFRYLGQHPDVGVADVKEVDHYAPMVYGGEPPPLEAYARHFEHCEQSRWRLEASPRYFIGGPSLVRRLASELDRPRVLIAIREPISRMWSSYTYKRSKDRLPPGMGFGEFFQACRKVADERLERRPESTAYRTLATGVYANYLGDWFDEFGADVRVVFFDDLASSPADEVLALCQWLGIADAPVADFDFEARNATYQPRSKTLRHAAHRINAGLRRVATDDSALKRGLRASYQRINAGHLDERLSAEDRERLQLFYQPTLPPLRRLLEDRGYAGVPAWLAEVVPA